MGLLYHNLQPVLCSCPDYLDEELLHGTVGETCPTPTQLLLPWAFLTAVITPRQLQSGDEVGQVSLEFGQTLLETMCRGQPVTQGKGNEGRNPGFSLFW